MRLARLVIVSNRVAVPDRTGKYVAGGLAVALREAFRSYQGLWFGWSGKVAAETSRRPDITDRGSVQYALVDLTSVDRREYYNGFADRALWPTMNYRVGLSEFSRADYIGYRRVNQTFARALALLIGPEDLVWVHDYHLIPLAEELRGLGLTNRIGYFHHIPWPAPEVLATLPGSKDLMSAIRSYDLIGVQTARDADNLRRNLQDELGGAPTAAAGAGPGHSPRIGTFPIGIDVEEFQQVATRSGSARLVQQTRAGLGSQRERVARWERMMLPFRKQDVSWWAGAFLKGLRGSTFAGASSSRLGREPD
jgi:trehalose 6-phosphate synthase